MFWVLKRTVLSAHWDGSFEYPQHIFWLRNKKIVFLLCTLNKRPVLRSLLHKKMLLKNTFHLMFSTIFTAMALEFQILSHITLCLLASPGDNLYKQFEPRSCLTKWWSGSKLFDTDVILENFFEKSRFWKKEKNHQKTKKTCKIIQ